MNKCAIVIPLHPKHYNFGYYIINELHNTNVDLYFVFTSLEDKNNFQTFLLEHIKLNFLILTDFTDLQIVINTNSFVSIKKLYALSVLHEKYEYISCIDSEIKFINKTNFYEIMRNIVNSKIMCGGKINDNMWGERSILIDSLIKISDNKSHNELRNISQDFTIYTWWSNLPVYDCKIAKHFLDWIDFRSCTLDRFCWNVFDDMLYNYFCILFYNYQLKVIPNLHHSLEFSDSKLVKYVDINLNKLYLVNNNAYKQDEEYYEKSGFYIVFHLDRTCFHQFN